MVCTQKNPNIVEFHDFWWAEDHIYVVMELCDGNLGQLMATYPNGFSRILLVDFLKQIIQGVLFLHSLTPPVCHRDLKPENSVSCSEIVNSMPSPIL
jgi:serine/threonine protein kinase